MPNRKIWFWSLVVLIFSLLPFGIAALSAGQNYVFGGFLLNPIDGNSYLAKMYEGFQGSWQFTLPFTPDPGQGSYLFLFYLFLGHVSRWLSLPLIITFHISRMLSSAALLVMLYRFFHFILGDTQLADAAYLLAILGSGLGWLAYPIFHQLSPDLWVAEAYPFLSIYSNPHFPLTLAILLWILLFSRRGLVGNNWLILFTAGVALGILLPFGVVLAISILAISSIWEWWETKTINWGPTLVLLISGGPVLLYQLWLTRTSTELAIWNAQNITLAPPLVDLIFGFLPVLAISIYACAKKFAQVKTEGRIFLIWTLIGLLLLYLPFNLQRRFMLGIFIPIAGLASLGLAEITYKKPARLMWAVSLVLILTLPTELIIILGGLQSTRTHDPAIYLTKGEYAAFQWIDQNTKQGDLIASSPDTGLLIPAYTGRRVLYGHPFETINADTQKKLAESIYQQGMIDTRELTVLHVDYLFVGPRERDLGLTVVPKIIPTVYQQEGVTIYKVGP